MWNRAGIALSIEELTPGEVGESRGRRVAANATLSHDQQSVRTGSVIGSAAFVRRSWKRSQQTTRRYSTGYL